MGIRDDLVSLADYTAQRTLSRMEGLTDEEFRWQPVPGAWTVRRLRSGRAVVDNNPVRPAPAPMTSIAWRVAHLIDVYGSERNGRWLRVDPLPSPPIASSPSTIAWTAHESIAILRTAIDHFVGLLRAVDDEQYWELLGEQAGQYKDASLAGFAMHQIDEAIHHGAEVAVLRDLYLWQRVEQTEPATVGEAAAAGRWDLVEALVLDGHDPNGPPPTPLHLACGLGDLEIVRLLVEHGADTTVKDDTYNASPSFWARFFGRTEVVDYLRSRPS